MEINYEDFRVDNQRIVDKIIAKTNTLETKDSVTQVKSIHHTQGIGNVSIAK